MNAQHMRKIAKMPQHHPPSPVLDEFAELLAEGVEPRDAAERMGRHRKCGDMMLVRLRRVMGEQAR